jgi:hypothetical protein
MTGLPQGERFQNCKPGVEANYFVKRYRNGLLRNALSTSI